MVELQKETSWQENIPAIWVESGKLITHDCGECKNLEEGYKQCN